MSILQPWIFREVKYQVLGNWVKQMLIQNLGIMCRLKEFATQQHSRTNENRLLSILLIFVIRHGKSGTVFTSYLQNVTEALLELGYKAAGLDCLMNIW